jgi:hypothetical protein
VGEVPPPVEPLDEEALPGEEARVSDADGAVVASPEPEDDAPPQAPRAIINARIKAIDPAACPVRRLIFFALFFSARFFIVQFFIENISFFVLDMACF